MDVIELFEESQISYDFSSFIGLDDVYELIFIGTFEEKVKHKTVSCSIFNSYNL